MGKRTTPRAAALFTYLLFLSAALAANPVGRGGLAVSGFREMLVPESKALVQEPGAVADAFYARKSLSGAGGSLALPLGERISLSFGGGGVQSSDNFQEQVNGNLNVLGYRLDGSQAWGDAALTLYPAAWTRHPYDDATDGNPDGWLYWPNLSLGSEYWIFQRTTTITDASGGFNNRRAAAPYQSDKWIYQAGLTLPLHRRLSLAASYAHDGQTHWQQGSAAGNLDGRYEMLGADLRLFLPVTRWSGGGDPDDYFFGVGWVGELLLDLGWRRFYDLALGLVAEEHQTLALLAPVHPAVAVGLSWDFYHWASGPFNGSRLVQDLQTDTASYSVGLLLRINFNRIFWW